MDARPIPQYGQSSCRPGAASIAISQQPRQRGTRTQPHARPLVRGTLIRLEVEHLPRPTKAPQPAVVLVVGATSHPIWRRSGRPMSPGSRLNTPSASSSRPCKWTTPKLRSPAAADRWTWLLLLAYVQLRLARDMVADVRLPWQRPLPPERRTPARVRRGFSHAPRTAGQSRQRTKTLRTLAGTTQRQALTACSALSSGQIDALSRPSHQ